MPRQMVIYKDLGKMDYQQAWDYQEYLLKRNVAVKSLIRAGDFADMPNADKKLVNPPGPDVFLLAASSITESIDQGSTVNYLLFVEHPPVYTLGKSGKVENVLINKEEMQSRGIDFFNTNRGGDITFHGPGQIVGYPILDLEKFYTDIGKYLRNLEEVIILTLQEFGIYGERSAGETGVWIDPGIRGKERKICAMGVRCSRWITMHGFALNVNTDLSYFGHIIPCGIQNKSVTSVANELKQEISMEKVKMSIRKNFESVFDCEVKD
jgi:lipoyl(octanoyl) transferase